MDTHSPSGKTGLRAALALCVATLFAVSIAPPRAVAQDPASPPAPAGKSIIVLDASGSMWGQIEGKHKIEIARDAIAELMETLPGELELGLMAYGHRRKGDCTDIELLVPPSRIDRKEFLDIVLEIMPKGKTPLTDAVEQAAAILKYEENPASVILVSDGIETCDRDPCELARTLAATGVAFRAHVVAFDLTSEEAESIRCLSDETGGKFLEARDAGTLKEALQIVVAEAAAPVLPEKEKPAAPTEDLTPATLTVPAQVKAGARFPVSWTGRENPDDYITIVAKNAGEKTNGNLVYTRSGSPVELLAPVEPGPHEIRYRTGHSGTIVGRAETVVVLDEASLEAPAEITAGAPIPVTWEGPDNPGDYITVVMAGAEDTFHGNIAYTRKGNPLEVRALETVGDAELRYIANQRSKVLARRPIKILAALATLSAPEEAPAGSEITVKWTGPGNQGDFITTVKTGAGAREYDGYKYARKDEGGEVKIGTSDQPGDYEVRYLTGQDRKTLAIAPIRLVATTATLEAPATVVAGATFDVSWTGPNHARDYITIVAKGADARKYNHYLNAARTELPGKLRALEVPGEYEVRYITGTDRNILASRPITITGASASIDAPESVVAGAEFEVTWTGPNNTGDYITIVAKGADERKYNHYFSTEKAAPPGKLRAVELPGEYEVRYHTRERRILASRPITITEATATLKVPESAVAGTEFTLEWTGPANQNDLITIVPKGAPAKKYGDYFYANRPRDPAVLRAGEEVGEAEVRYVTARDKRILASAPLTVTEATATLKAPGEVVAGSNVSVTWTAPGGRKDLILIMPKEDTANKAIGRSYAYTERGSPSIVEAWEKPGNYEVRYVNAKTRETMASIPIVIKAAVAAIKAPAEAAPGERIRIEWTGPNNRSDIVTIAKPGDEGKKYETYRSVTQGSPQEIFAPKTPGDYEIRYVTGREKKILTRRTLKVAGE